MRYSRVIQLGKQLYSHQTWLDIHKIFQDHVNVKYMQLNLACNQASKGTRSTAKYLLFIKSIVDSLHSIERSLDDDDVILQVLF